MGRLERLENWHRLFQDAVDAKLDAPFEYGRHDCCLSVCDVIFAFTGTDPAEGFRGYSSREEVLEYRRLYRNVMGIAEYVARKLEAPEIASNFAGAGDAVVVKDEEEGFCLGLVELNGLHVIGAGDVGWRYWPRETIVKAWKVG